MALYVGIENEFQLFREHRQLPFHEQFARLLQRYPHPMYRKGNTCIRTHNGGSIYADGAEPETCTPPIMIERGFATNVANALYNARRDLLNFTGSDTTLALTGYSMHYNITRGKRMPHLQSHRSLYLSSLAIPFGMFTLTPLSIGINLREKSSEHGTRFELLGDHIPGEEQVAAFMLLYAGMMTHHNPSNAPICIDIDHALGNNEMYRSILKNGRESNVPVLIRSENNGSITSDVIIAQEYLERYHHHIKKHLPHIATPDERKLLDDFVSGRRELEIDKTSKYLRMKKFKEGSRLRPNAITCINPEHYTHSQAVPRGLPKFFGWLATQEVPRPGDYDPCPIRIRRMDWEEIEFYDQEFDDTAIEWELKSLDTLAIVADVVEKLPTKEDALDFMVMMSDLMEHTRSHRMLYTGLQAVAYGYAGALDGPSQVILLEEGLMDRNGKIGFFGEKLLTAYNERFFKRKTKLVKEIEADMAALAKKADESETTLSTGGSYA